MHNADVTRGLLRKVPLRDKWCLTGAALLFASGPIFHVREAKKTLWQLDFCFLPLRISHSVLNLFVSKCFFFILRMESFWLPPPFVVPRLSSSSQHLSHYSHLWIICAAVPLSQPSPSPWTHSQENAGIYYLRSPSCPTFSPLFS